MNFKCVVCGKEFVVKIDKIHKGKYCSKECYYKGRWGNSHKEVVKCIKCGNDFVKFKSNNKKFCSLTCQYQWRSENFSGDKSPRYKGRIKYGTDNRYYAIPVPYHPYCNSKGYVMEHRLVMEKHLKRFLSQSEIVHHIDGNPRNNNIDNLILMDKVEHDRLHTQNRWDTNSFKR